MVNYCDGEKKVLSSENEKQPLTSEEEKSTPEKIMDVVSSMSERRQEYVLEIVKVLKEAWR